MWFKTITNWVDKENRPLQFSNPPNEKMKCASKLSQVGRTKKNDNLLIHCPSLNQHWLPVALPKEPRQRNWSDWPLRRLSVARLWQLWSPFPCSQTSRQRLSSSKHCLLSPQHTASWRPDASCPPLRINSDTEQWTGWLINDGFCRGG